MCGLGGIGPPINGCGSDGLFMLLLFTWSSYPNRGGGWPGGGIGGGPGGWTGGCCMNPGGGP